MKIDAENTIIHKLKNPKCFITYFEIGWCAGNQRSIYILILMLIL